MDILSRFFEEYVEILSRFGDYQSRADQREFLIYHVGTCLVVFFLGVFLFLFPIPEGMMGPFRLGCIVCFWIPEITVTARRLNDLGHSRWWMFLFLVPVVNTVFFLYLLCVPGRQS
ncbi:MAG: DUF805 domain-containing protein [Planctomycetia bacterium]|nr:DUF805 domain-containing protein [Planctomycetia bacterium]